MYPELEDELCAMRDLFERGERVESKSEGKEREDGMKNGLFSQQEDAEEEDKWQPDAAVEDKLLCDVCGELLFRPSLVRACGCVMRDGCCALLIHTVDMLFVRLAVPSASPSILSVQFPHVNSAWLGGPTNSSSRSRQQQC